MVNTSSKSIGVIGATGKAGSALTAEALSRGHQVTALVRSEEKTREIFGDDVAVVQKEALDIAAEDLQGLDVVVNAFGVAPDKAMEHIALTKHLVELDNLPRLIFILGAGSLTTGEDNHLFVEDIRAIPGSDAFIAIPETQLKQLEYLRGLEGVDWTGVSPQADFSVGEATTPVLGSDEILQAADGKSHTTTGTMAVAVVDEIENPVHRGTRFTVSDA